MSARNILVLLFISFYIPEICSQSFSSDIILDTTAVDLQSQTGGDIAVSNEGVLGVTWVDLVNPWPNGWINILNFAKSTDHGKIFIKTVLDSIPDLAGYSGYIFSPKVHFDKTGNIWIAENISVEIYPSLLILKSTDGGETFLRFYPNSSDLTCQSVASDSLGNVFILAAQMLWSDIVKLMVIKFNEGNLNDTVITIIAKPDSGTIHHPAIAADKDGKNIFLVFQKNAANSKLFFVRSEDGGLTFSSPRQLDPTLLNEINQHSPAITIWNNKIVITWSDNRSGDYRLYYTESADSGNTFSPPVQVSDEGAWLKFITGNNGMLNILWGTYNNYPEDIYFTNKLAGSDTFAVPLKPGDPAFHNSHQIPLGIAADHEGFTYILFQDDRPNTDPYFYYDSLRIFLATAKFSLSRTDDEINYPADYHLSPNYPNPFNPSTTINYSLAQTGRVILSIYDLLGREVAKLIDEEKPAGEYETTWNASSHPSGVYFLRMQAGQFSETRKLLLIK